MEKVSNYNWLYSIPQGWVELARKMIEECEAIDSTYYICDLKEKWGVLCVISNCDVLYLPEIDIIENKYEKLSARTCCICGKPATKMSTGWICPYCDDCGDKDEKFYKRFI